MYTFRQKLSLAIHHCIGLMLDKMINLTGNNEDYQKLRQETLEYEHILQRTYRIGNAVNLLRKYPYAEIAEIVQILSPTNFIETLNKIQR